MGSPRGNSQLESLGFDLEFIDFNPGDVINTMPTVRLGSNEYSVFNVEWIRELFRRIEQVFGAIERNFQSLTYQINLGGTILIAYQFVQITSDMLSSSNDPSGTAVPRSVITTASQTTTEFNWMMAGMSPYASVSLGAGAGVVAHPVLVDLNDENNAIQRKKAVSGAIQDTTSAIFRPYGTTGLQVQCCNVLADGNVLRVYPKSVAVGTWLLAQQVLPQINFKNP